MKKQSDLRIHSIVVTNVRLRNKRAFCWLAAIVLLAILHLTACSTTKSGNVYPTSSTTPQQTSLKVESDKRTLHNVAGQLENTRSEFKALHQNAGWTQRGYFVAEENNRIERLYFRFVVGHTTLWDIINSYGGTQTRFNDDEIGIKAHANVMYAEF